METPKKLSLLKLPLPGVNKTVGIVLNNQMLNELQVKTGLPMNDILETIQKLETLGILQRETGTIH